MTEYSFCRVVSFNIGFPVNTSTSAEHSTPWLFVISRFLALEYVISLINHPQGKRPLTIYNKHIHVFRHKFILLFHCFLILNIRLISDNSQKYYIDPMRIKNTKFIKTSEHLAKTNHVILNVVAIWRQKFAFSLVRYWQMSIKYHVIPNNFAVPSVLVEPPAILCWWLLYYLKCFKNYKRIFQVFAVFGLLDNNFSL